MSASRPGFVLLFWLVFLFSAKVAKHGLILYHILLHLRLLVDLFVVGIPVLGGNESESGWSELIVGRQRAPDVPDVGTYVASQ